VTVDLRLGDCLEVMPSIPSGSVDMILADLPYGTTACKWDTIIPLEPLWAEYKRVIKRNGAIVLTASQPFTTTLIASNKAWFKHELIWNKGRGYEPQLCNIRPMKAHDNVLVFGEGRVTYNPQKTTLDMPDKRVASGRRNNRKDGSGLNILASVNATSKQYVDRYPISVMYFDNANQASKQHPTQKPVALMEYLIKTYTNEGETVLDNTMGSGTCGVACVNTGRNFIGIELDGGYFKIAQERIEKAQNVARQLEMAIA
jgi:DNA modification methylase